MRHSVFTAFTALFFVAITVIAIAPGGNAQTAAEVKTNLHSGEAPGWVVKQSYDPAALVGQATGGPAYLLHSYQRKLTDKNEIYYSRRVTRLDDVESIEDASQLSISFDPTYERLEIHNIFVIRDGIADDRLNINNFKFLHTESDASRLIFNGTVSASLILKDIRAGDILDVAYSIHGKNPAFFGHISDVIELQYSVPIGHQYRSIRVPSDRTYQSRRYANAPEPEIENAGDETIYSWDQHNVASISGQDNVPNWYTDFGYFELTDMPDWESLGAFYSTAYQRTAPLSAELVAQIENIKNLHTDDKARTRAALDFVQREIRYLGIEVGKGGYVPRDPSLVSAQRFGDCKDKTVLLVAMLGEMNIKASPLLVDTDNYDHFTDRLPSGYAFDHVITKVTIGETEYWLDGTRSPQIGTLDTLEQSDYSAGLVVEGPQSAVNKKHSPAAGESFEAVVIDTFDLAADKTTIGYTAKTILRGGRADGFLSRFHRDGRVSMEESYLSYYQDNYPTIEKTKDLEVIEDQDNASVTILEHYSIPEGWTLEDDGKTEEFYAWPFTVRGKMTDVDKIKRTAPFSTKNLAHVRHEIRFLLNDGWSFEPEKKHYDNVNFSFEKTESFVDNIYSEIYEFRSKSRAVAANDHIAVATDFEGAWDDAGVTLMRHVKTADPKLMAGELSAKITNLVEQFSIVLIIALLAFSVFAFVKAVEFDVDRRSDAVYYPISVSKFLVMSVASLGTYVFYWTFKNWQWIRDVKGEANSPFWRSLFAIFMNFSLFPRIAGHDNESGKRLASLAGFLALLYLVIYLAGSISDLIVDEDDLVVSMLVLVFQLAGEILIILPFVIHILWLNQGNPESTKLNSQYHWHGIYALVLGLVLWVLVAFGMLASI